MPFVANLLEAFPDLRGPRRRGSGSLGPHPRPNEASTSKGAVGFGMVAEAVFLLNLASGSQAIGESPPGHFWRALRDCEDGAFQSTDLTR